MKNPFRGNTAPNLPNQISAEGRRLTPDILTSREKRMAKVYEKKFGRKVVRYVVGSKVDIPNE